MAGAGHLDGRKITFVDARAPNLLEAIRIVRPQGDRVTILVKQPGQGCSPRAGANDGHFHSGGFLKLMRLSVPLINRAMLGLCFHSASPPMAAATVIIAGGYLKITAAIGRDTAAAIEPSDT